MERTPRVRIDPLEESSLPELVRMVLALWPECNAEDELKSYRNILNDTSSHVLIAKVETKSAGFIHLSTRNDWVEGTITSPVAYIEGIYVKPQYRKQKIAVSLVRHGEKWALSRGLSEMGSDTEIENVISQDFHRSIGFKETNRIVCFSRKIK